MPKSNKRPLAVLAVNKLRKISDCILQSRTIVLNIGNNPGFFATPLPALFTVTSDIDSLEEAEAIAKTRVTGSAAARDLEYEVVLDDLRGLLGYVQNLADLSMDETTAIAIINASGFGLKNHGVRVKPPLAAKTGPASGSVQLTAKGAGKRAVYEWQQSADGITGHDLPITFQAKKTVTGLTPDTKVYFRERAVTKEGPQVWSAWVSIIVV